MVLGGQKVRTDGLTEWMDGQQQNYIPPTSSGYNNRVKVSHYNETKKRAHDS